MQDLPAGLDVPGSDFPGLAVQLRNDSGVAAAGRRYVLRYEALSVLVSAPPRTQSGPLEVMLVTSPAEVPYCRA